MGSLPSRQIFVQKPPCGAVKAAFRLAWPGSCLVFLKPSTCQPHAEPQNYPETLKLPNLDALTLQYYDDDDYYSSIIIVITIFGYF